jgi:DNA-binding beta-propeller fold protein YncE
MNSERDRAVSWSRHIAVSVLCLALLASGCVRSGLGKGAAILPTGMRITPAAAKGTLLLPLNPDLPEMPDYTADHPISTALSPDGNTLLVLTSGYNRNNDARQKAIPALSSEYVFVYDVRQPHPVKRQVLRVPNTYAGLAWAPDGKRFFVPGGMDDNVHVFEQQGDEWKESGEPIALAHEKGLGIPWGEEKANHPLAAGLAVSPDGTKLLVANYSNDSVSLVDLYQRTKIAELDLRPGRNDPRQKGIPGGEYPFWAVFQTNNKAYVSSVRDREIVVLTLPPSLAIAGRIKLHGQPGKMIVNKAGTLLFAVADNSDSVAVIDTKNDRVAAEIKTTAPPGLLTKAGALKGSNPNALALSPDEQTLYVSNGGTNSVAVIALKKDLDDSHVEGLLPTGWYPTSVSVSADGNRLYITNAKSEPGANPRGCRDSMTTSTDRPCSLAQQFVWQLEKGGLAVVPAPSTAELKALTEQVARNNDFVVTPPSQKQRETFAFLRKKIHHVIYIVKENRTYDQVLGDLEKGNGDPSLTLFPEALTPNHHELARRFVTLDNFYASGEISGSGWNWSTAARATDVVERTMPMDSARRGVTYDVEGTNRGINVAGHSSEERNTTKLDDADDQLPGTANVASPDGPDDESGAGYLWDSAMRAGLTIRNYGFFLDLGHYSKSELLGPAWPLLHDPAASRTRVAVAAVPHLEAITDPYFRGFDMRFPDYWRYKEWEREFDGYVRDGNLPALELVRLPHDHLGNFSEAIDGVNTVETQIADNDYALGLLVEKISRSRYAADTLIFVVEDDAQDGPDHVDAHRSLAYVIGPCVKHGAVISRHYTSVSVLRTIEEVLGIKPLGLNDALQPPMAEVFSRRQTAWNYSARVPQVLRKTQLPLPQLTAFAEQRVPSSVHDSGYWAEKTRSFDFSAEDKLDSAAFNLVLWEGMKGKEHPYPAERDGRNLSKNRRQLLRANKALRKPGSKD